MTRKVLGVFDTITDLAFGAFKKVLGLVFVTALLTSIITALFMFLGYVLVK